MKTRISVQERLKDLRVERGLNLEELAQETGISKSALGSYENDNDEYKEINHGSLLKLADFYKVSVDYLLGLTNNRKYENTPIEELHYLPLSYFLSCYHKQGIISIFLVVPFQAHCYSKHFKIGSIYFLSEIS